MSKPQTFPFLAALEHSHVPSAVLTPDDGRLTWMNPAARALVGDCRGKTWTDAGILTEDGLEVSRAAWQTLVNGGIGHSVVYDTVLKTPDGTEVTVAASSVLMDAGGVPVVFRQFYPKPAESSVTRCLKRRLSDRQLEVLRMVAQGCTTEEIAAHLHLTVSTVRTHETRIRGILRVKSRAAAVALAYQEGLL